MRLLANSLLRANADEVVRHRRSVKNTRRFLISVMSLHLFELSLLKLLGKRSDLDLSSVYQSSNQPSLHSSQLTAHSTSQFTATQLEYLQSAMILHGSRFTVHGSRFTVHGSRFAVHGSRFACFTVYLIILLSIEY